MPVTVTEVPTGPFKGFRVIDGVMVYVVVAVLLLASVAVTILPPMVEVGAVNVALNEP